MEGGGDHDMLRRLLAENARLRSQAKQPEHERVLQDVLAMQLKHFFDDARREGEESIVGAHALSGDGDGPQQETVARENVAQRFSALVETLCILGTQNEELQRRMSDMQTKTVASLNEKVEVLEADRNSLRHRVAELEKDMVVAVAKEVTNEELVSPLMAELQSLRASEELLRQQLRGIHERGEAAVVEYEKLVKDGISAAALLPRLLESVEQMRETLKTVEGERDVLLLQLQELKERQNVQYLLRETQLQDQLALSQSSTQNLLTRIAALEAREAKAREETAACKQTIEQQQGVIQSLQASQGGAGETLASKRRRLESEISDNPDSVRRDLVAFWYEGREELQKLREEVQHLRSKVQQLKPLREKLGQLERNRSAVASRIVDLADEVSRVREENQKLRAQYSGVEVECDYLRGSLAAVVSQQMQEEELSSCCAVVREAAARSATASARVVMDPQAAQQTMRQVRELNSEVAQLGKQKEKLQRCITLREERLAALIAREVVQSPAAGAHRSEDVPKVLGPPVAAGNGSIVQNIALAEAYTSDVLCGLEGSAVTESGLQRRETFTAMQARLSAVEQEMAACKRQLQAAHDSREDAEARYLAALSELQATLNAREAAMAEMHQTNTVLLHSVERLRSELKRLRETYSDLGSFTQKLVSALGVMLLFVRGETSLAASVSTLVSRHRSEICQLTRRVADGWEMRKDDVQRVVESLERMCEYVAQTAEQNQRERALNSVAHLRRLTDAVKQQEGRLKDMQESFSESCQRLGESLAHRVVEAQRQADGLWKKRFGVLQEERHRLQGQLKTERDILSRMECLMTAAPNAQPATAAEEAATMRGTTSSLGLATDLGGGEENEVVNTINRLLAAVSQPDSEVDVRAAVVHPEGHCEQ